MQSRTLKIALAQLNSVVEDLAGNAARLREVRRPWRPPQAPPRGKAPPDCTGGGALDVRGVELASRGSLWAIRYT